MDPTPMPSPMPGPAPAPTDFDVSNYTDSSGRVVVFLVLFGLVLAFVMFRLIASSRAQESARKAQPIAPLPKVGIEAGWYPTPDETQERYHDGNRWTDEFRPLSMPEAPAAPSSEDEREEAIVEEPKDTLH